MAELQRQISKSVLVRNPSTRAAVGKSPRVPGSRRVSLEFEVPKSHESGRHHRSGLSDIDTLSIDHLDDKGRYRRCFFACCAWACFLLFIIIVVVLFAGISYLAFLQSGMPNVNVRALNITKLEVNENKMNAAIDMTLRISNNNDKLVLLYSALSVFVTSQRFTLGETRISGFSQRPKNDTDFEMKMVLNNVDVNKFAVDELKSDISAKEVAYDVYVQGKIGFKVGSLKMDNVPFLSSCRKINQRDVDLGRRPGCDARMFASRPSNN